MCKLKIEDSTRKIMYCGDITGYPTCVDDPKVQCELKPKLRLYTTQYIPPPAPTKCKLI
jgi:hypothetical protein